MTAAVLRAVIENVIRKATIKNLSLATLVTFGFVLPVGFAQGAPKKLTDSEIAGLVMTVNEGEMEPGRLATSRAQNDQVKAYAEKMISGHQANTNEAERLSQLTGMDAPKTDRSEALKAKITASNKNLQTMSKGDFDKAYLNQQIDMHRESLSLLKNQWIPSATNPEFRAYLEKTKETVAAHLVEAQNLQSKLK